MKDCIFCKIINNEVDAKKVYEDDRVLCFLDINPLNKGHCLVIPKKHAENIFEIEKEDLERVVSVAKKVSLMIKQNLGADGVNLLHASGKTAQQSVFHFHLHIVPRYKNDGMDVWPESVYDGKDFDNILEKIKG